MVIKISNGRSTIIEDVLYVSGMKYNILSVGQLIAQEMVIDMPKFSMFNKLCESCLLGK